MIPRTSTATQNQTTSVSTRVCRQSFLRTNHIAAPYPGTPFFFMVMENNWFRPGTKWEQVDMDQSTVLQYGNLSAEDLEQEARRAMREWMFRPGPIITYLKSLRSAIDVSWQQVKWALFPNAAH